MRAAFGWSGDIRVDAGPRGAEGRIWRVAVESSRYALKESIGAPPSPATVAAQVRLMRDAAAAGVHVTASHADRQGRHVLPGVDGTWLRLYDWLDLQPVVPSAESAQRLGALLARLHSSAPPADAEPDGGRPASWYDLAPSPSSWAPFAEADAPWAAALRRRLPELPALCAVATPADPRRCLLCHRDLHPENVLRKPSGGLAVIDWDDVGPAEPGREVAQMLFDWLCDGSTIDLAAARELYVAYVGEGGPGRISEPADFSMLVASRLNFLQHELRVALDPSAEQGHRDWATREVDEALRILPTARQLHAVLDGVARLG
nr:aminoglycoside phosphotransferase family protein [Motilibacter aurantiacus]